MRCLIYILIGGFLTQGCSSSPARENKTLENPLEKYLSAKKSIENGDYESNYSLEYLKAQAAQYLLSQGKTELKSANSAKAVHHLSKAREYNPWNDEIKDLYTLSIKFLVRSTKELNNVPCEVINERLSLIYSVSNDQISNLSELVKKCNFNPHKNIQTNLDFKLIPQITALEKKIFASLEEEAKEIIKRNAYTPKRELAYLALSYLSNLEFILGEPKVSELTSTYDDVILKIPISVNVKNDPNSEEYCEKTKELIWRQEFEDEYNSPDNLKGNVGHLRCRYFNGDKRFLDVYTNPNWQDSFKFLYPLPVDSVFVITFKYKNGTKKEFRNIFQNSFKPNNVQYGAGFLMHFLKGELKTKLRPSKVFGDENQYLEISTTQNNVTGLDKISIQIDLPATFNFYINNEYKEFEHIIVEE